MPEKISSLDLKLFKSLTNLTNIQDSLMKPKLVVFAKKWLVEATLRETEMSKHSNEKGFSTWFFPRIFNKHFLRVAVISSAIPSRHSWS